MKEMVGGCCVCSDERGWPDNPLVYCDGNGCTVAVHQACYGIVSVPTGPWYCRKCESPETKGKVRCELCPSKSGALKRADTGGWAHVVCALYIPEVRFGNVTSMEPIVLRLIPPERYNKTCYICQDLGKSHRASAGACMQCNKSGCKQQFHVTCAQSLGLLCEEAGNYLDNVKYCGYCQHHYSKLKKGGNVKTIPPYKPVSHDSQSSDSSGEKEGEASPKAGGAATPTHSSKNKGPGRKSSHSSSSGGKTPSSKTPTNTSTSMDTSQESPETPASTPASRRHKTEKNKSRKSPSRRGSSAGDGGSKSSTPAPSPQHSSEAPSPHAGKAGGSTPGGSSKVAPPAASPGSTKSQESSVISSVASAAAAIQATPSTAPPTSTSITTSVVQAMAQQPKPTYPESVITNTDSVEMKQTKKRKAISAAASAVDYATTPPLPPPPPNTADGQQPAGNMWERNPHAAGADVAMECDKKKAKTEPEPAVIAHYPPPPPPAHSPAMQPSPRHLQSPMPGPSGMAGAPAPPGNTRSPSGQSQGKEREGPASLLVSVPLPPAPHGLGRVAHAQIGSAPPENRGPSPHIFHQAKHAAMESSVPSHSPHGVASRATWGGLNVSYEMQPPDKTGMGQPPGGSKEAGAAAVRNKKRAAMAASVVSVPGSNPPLPPSSVQNLASVRRPPQPTPPPIYQETIKDSPPSSPGSERPLKPKVENKIGASCAAPHMLGNELNPESGAAARLQEQLSAELAAHAAGAAAGSSLLPPPLINKATQGATSGRGGGSSAQSLDQLLERQWEQGSQFLMEQAQHFDIASLLSCLHQLRTENVRLEDHVGNLLQRRDHLLAVNARLAIPLNTAGGPPEPSRCPRENGNGQMRAPPGPARPEGINPERSHQLMVRDAPKPS